MKWVLVAGMLALTPPCLAWVYLEGDVAADYGVAGVDSEGYEYLSAWISIDTVYSDYPGPYASTSVGVLLRLSDSEHPLDGGYDVAYHYLGLMRAGDAFEDLHLEVPADAVPAGEYWMHLLLMDDRRWRESYDSRTLQPSLVWRGGIALQGALDVVEYSDHSLRVRVPQVRNNRFHGHSRDLHARLYSTHTTGPAGRPTPVCDFELPGLFAGEMIYDLELFCTPPQPIHPADTLHLALGEVGGAGADVSSEANGYTGSVYWAGSSGPATIWLLLLLGLPGAIARRHARLRRRPCGSRIRGPVPGTSPAIC